MRWEMECVLRKGVGLHKRTGPSTSYRIVGKWYRGDKFIVNDTKTVGHFTWYKIEGTSYWSCGKEGSATYLKKIRDLDPPAPPPPPPDPIPEPKPDPPVPPPPPWVPPDFGSNTIGSGFVDTGIDNWYVKPRPYQKEGYSISSRSVPFMTNWDAVSDATIEEEMRRIRYNMDIAYMNRDEVFSSHQNNGYFSDLQAKIHNSFNRNKTAFPDKELSKSFAYVFFTRPDLNLCKYSGGEWAMHSQTHFDDMYDYIWRSNPWTIKSLVEKGNPFHKFLVLLSNEAKSFEVEDKVIKTVEHGETFTGAQVVYGRTDHESAAAGEMSIRYVDTVNLDIYKMHEIWTDYINKVSRGEFSPRKEYIKDKILDYASSCYYFLCGPDGSTILYWQKLTGVFPVNTGENVFSWDAGTLLSKPEINIKYVYAMKTPMDVRHLTEFNGLVSAGRERNIKTTYSQDNVATGSTLTHAPFITYKNENGRAVFRLNWLNVN